MKITSLILAHHFHPSQNITSSDIPGEVSSERMGPGRTKGSLLSLYLFIQWD